MNSWVDNYSEILRLLKYTKLTLKLKTMKLPILTTKYNCIVVILTFCVITLFSSCNDDDNNPCHYGHNDEVSAKSKTTLILESFNLLDIGNEGNASDIFLRCKLSGTLDRFQKLRFI